MEKINCRGHHTRVELCEKYIITPEFRTKLLRGVSSAAIASDAGGKIVDEYYLFSVRERTSQDDTGSFVAQIICGERAASDFLKITGSKKPPLFQLLRPSSASEKTTLKKSCHSQASTEAKPNDTENSIAWHPVNQQLYDAIRILLLVWGDLSSTSVLFKAMKKCETYPSFYPFPDRLRSFNSCVKKDKRKTLENILWDLKKSNPDLRDFDFHLLHEAVIRAGAKSFILNQT